VRVVWNPTVRLALFLVFFDAVAIAIVTQYLGVWREWDWRVSQFLLQGQRPTLCCNIELVDVASYHDGGAADRRRFLASFLDRLRTNGDHPSAVILDFWFDINKDVPADANRALRSALRRATFRIALPWNPTAQGDADVLSPRYLDDLDRDTVYDHVGAALKGHTIFKAAAGGGAYYRSCYDFPGLQPIVALPLLLNPRPNPCVPASHVVPLGDHPSALSIEPGHFPPPGATTDKILIVGTLSDDQGPIAGYPNPELLAWAVNDELNRFDIQPLNGNLFALVAGFVLVTVAGYFGIFYWSRRWKLGSWRPALPWLVSAAAAIAAIAAFFAVELLLLTLHTIQPQISLTLVAIVITSALCGVFGRALLSKTLGWSEEPPEEVDWDVFVSYPRCDADWAFAHVVQPLRAAGLTVFFDKDSILSGHDWPAKLAYGIEYSRYVIALYSREFFDGYYCRYEISRALQKWIMARMDDSVRPVMLRPVEIPLEYNAINATDLGHSPGALDAIVAEIIRATQAQRLAETVSA